MAVQGAFHREDQSRSDRAALWKAPGAGSDGRVFFWSAPAALDLFEAFSATAHSGCCSVVGRSAEMVVDEIALSKKGWLVCYRKTFLQCPFHTPQQVVLG